jgi:hypothetical protein
LGFAPAPLLPILRNWNIYEKKGMPDEAIAGYLKALGPAPEEVNRRRTAYQKRGLPCYWQEGRPPGNAPTEENAPVREGLHFAHTELC